MIAIAIDDEPIALDIVAAHAAKVPFIELAASFTNAFDAIAFLQQNKVDLIIDGGYGENIASTIIDLTGHEPIVVREGKGDVSII